MAFAPIALTALSTAFGVIGSIQQGNAAEQAADFNASVANQNATIARRQAAKETAQIRKTNLLRLGSIRAKAGKAGSISGSALDILAFTSSEGELEAKNALFQGELESRRFKNQASLDLFRGKSAKRAGRIGAAGSLLKGASTGFTQFQGLKRE